MLLQILERPLLNLTLLLILSKVVYIFLACCAPGPGYDTSTQLTFELFGDGIGSPAAVTQSWPLKLASKLVRWDGIYFVSAAARGQVNEQEWAFGWGFSKLIAILTRFLFPGQQGVFHPAIVGISIANISHLLSVLVLYRLAWLLNGNNKSQAFIASCLHVFAPGGLFLSAPYAESLFSLLNFSGMLVYCEARRAGIAKGRQRDLFLILSGLIFGAAATVRSNAIFSGILFAYEALVCLPKLPQLLTSVSGLRYVFSLVLGGSLAGLGFALPQYIAYLEYCTDSIPAAQRRTWCDAFPPSIYTFVQGHYWNVGFLRYWTVSNLPLFVLATPMLAIMFFSGVSAFKLDKQFQTVSGAKTSQGAQPRLRDRLIGECLVRFALPQILLTILAFTTFHVQTISRIASGYPLPYLWLAARLVNHHQHGTKSRDMISYVSIRFMIIYALVQGGLYASFLPPA